MASRHVENREERPWGGSCHYIAALTRMEHRGMEKLFDNRSKNLLIAGWSFNKTESEIINVHKTKEQSEHNNT